MRNRLVRNLTVLSIVILCVISARHPLINAVSAMFVGAWAMAKLFMYLFGPEQEFEDLTWDRFVPFPYVLRTNLIMLLHPTGRKQTLFLLLWWSSGILVTVVTYKLLNALLVSS
jgi:hypothetical protein